MESAWQLGKVSYWDTPPKTNMEPENASEKKGETSTKPPIVGFHMGVEPKIGGKPPKMDGLFHGKPY